jgi:nucleotide-binding universal stress UspA family protein
MKASTKRIELPKKRTDNGHPRLEGRPSEMSPEGRLELRSILVPVDFSRPSLKALKYAAAFAERFDAKITLLHVVEPLGLPDFAATSPLVIESEKLVRMAEDKLRGLPDRCDVAKAIVEKTLVRTGKAYHEIVEAARTLKVDLIIIATNGNTGIKHVLLGSTTERVVRHARCPVFVVREEEREILQTK